MTSNERGMAAPFALIMLLVVASLGFAVAAMGNLVPAGGEHEPSVQARMAADAGVEWAYRTLTAAPDWDALLAGATSANGVTLAADVSVPGAVPGTRYTAILRNDNVSGDSAVTGIPLDTAGGNTVDTNGHVVVTVTGVSGAARHTVQAVVRRIALPSVAATLSLTGQDTTTSFVGDGWEIDGNDVNLDGTAGTCAPRYGIATGSAPGEAVVEASIAPAIKNSVRGRATGGAGTSAGDAAITTDATVTSADVARFLTEVAPLADLKLRSTRSAPLSFTNVGASCATDWNSPNCWGTPERPKVVHVKADADPLSSFAALSLNGSTTGYGILIVEDGDLRVTGALNWNGLVIVSGRWVGVGLLGSSQPQTIHGAVIANETSTEPGLAEGVVQGTAAIRYSCEAINLAKSAPKLTSIRTRSL